MNKFSKFTNLNVSNNSNLSFSLIKSESLVSFCKKNKITNLSTCDYYQYDFINFYFLCKKNKITPIWGIKKILLHKEKKHFLSIFPTNYSNYKAINSFFYRNSTEKFIDFENLIKNIEFFLKNSLLVFEIRSFFEFEEFQKIKNVISKKFDDVFPSGVYVGINFIPTKNKIDYLLSYQNRSEIIPFYSIKYLIREEKEYLNKFKSLDKKILDEFENEDLNQNYFHYLSYGDFEETVKNKQFAELLNLNLQSFVSNIRIIIKSSSKSEKELEFAELEKKCFFGLKELNVFDKEKYEKILKEELDVIKKKNYSKYFNTLYKIIKIFRNSKIEIGPGRGSSVSSLVSYLTGITQIDPVKNDLYFWRFLNEKRDDFPDVDIDINDQNKAFKELVENFGRSFVSKISVRKSIGLAFLINSSLEKFELDQEDKIFILENIDKVTKIFKENPEISDFKDLKMRSIFERNDFFFNFLKSFYKISIGFTSHPSGFVISEKRLPSLLPVEKDENENLVCSYPSKSLEILGFKKFDFLSLTESLNFVKFMRNSFPQIPSYKDISFEDFKTWDLLKNSLVTYVFQLDSKFSRNNLLRIKPSFFNDLVLAISLNRPGVNANSNSIIQNKLSKQNFEFSSSFINEVLSPTYGNIIFEEQVSIILSFCMSLDVYESELLRKNLKNEFFEKKNLSSFKENFFQTSIKMINFDDQKLLFKKIVESMPYMFNKSHAVSYSYLTYYVSYIKSNYFEETTKYFLNKSMSDTNKTFLIFSEIFLKDYEIIKPEINSSLCENVFVSKKFVLGFSSLSNYDSQLFESIIENRNNFGKYKNVRDFIDRNINVLRENFEIFLPWINMGILRSLDYESSQIVENFDFFSRYIKIKSVLFFENEIPFLEKSNIIATKKLPKETNEKELSSFNFYVSYFDRWKQIKKNRNFDIYSLQEKIQENSKISNFKIYSILHKIRKSKDNYFFLIFDINQIFEIFVSWKIMKKIEDIISENKEFIFEIESFQEGSFDQSISLKSIKEV